MKLIPQIGQQIVLLVSSYDGNNTSNVPATVQDLLAMQFTALSEDGRVHYRLYGDYKDTWLLPETPAQTQAREMYEWDL